MSLYDGILVANLGSPEELSLPAVKKYLTEFLTDKNVIDIPWPIRQFLVRAIIVPRRSKKTIQMYDKIWRADGSPLTLYTESFAHKLRKEIPIPIAVGMRYPFSSLQRAFENLTQQGASNILVFPLFPQYAMSTTQSLEQAVAKLAKKFSVQVTVFPPYYNHSEWIKAQAKRVQPLIHENPDFVLFSFHGIPIRHLKKADKTNHCLSEQCCEVPSKAHLTCYQKHCIDSANLIAKALNIPKEKFSIAYQSRFGRNWLSPHTDEVAVQLAKDGVSSLLVVSPSFVTDGLETLEELGIRLKEKFLQAGGKKFMLAPALNDSEEWIESATRMITSFHA